jgi:hypothetical protein
MKIHGGIELQLHTLLILALNGSEWSASQPGYFTPRKRAPGTHWKDGPRVSLDAVAKRRSSFFALNLKHRASKMRRGDYIKHSKYF